MRIDDYKYRFIEQPDGWLGGKVHVDAPSITNLRLDPFERLGMPVNGRWTARRASSTSGHVSVLALRVRPAGGGQARPDRDRVPADAEGASFNLDAVKSRSLQP